MENRTQNIVYIGRKRFKPDNVAGTDTVWLEYGDVQEVPYKASVKLLKHPDVWVTEKEFAKMPKALPKKSAGSTGAPATQKTGVVTHKFPPNDLDDSGVDDGDDSGGDDESTGEGGGAGDGDNTGGNDRESMIRNAILGLDKAEGFGKNGNPKVSAVRAVTGDDSIVVKEVNAVWSAMQEAG